jgi:predicted O-methyltransferase YrrM
MTRKTLNLTDALHDYLLSASLREPPVLRQLREETASEPLARMQIAPEQGQLMALLVRLMGARKALEIGVFTGYSSLAVAMALPEGGKLVALDNDAAWTATAQRYWASAGVADRIELRLAPALESLDRLVREGQAGSFDFAFIDADKDGYLAYYERCLALLRPGGLVAVDNVLWSGRVADPADDDEDTHALRDFNDFVLADQRVDLSMVPIGDGLTLARKRGWGEG